MLSSDRDGGVRSTTKVNGNMRLLRRADLGERFLHLVETACEIERPFCSPRATDNLQVFIRACVALIMSEPITVAALLVIGAAGNDVQPEAAIGQGIERCRGPRR